MWLLDFLWEILRDFLVWGFMAKRVLRWLTPRFGPLARLRAQHERYLLKQIAGQSGRRLREGAEVKVGFTARPVSRLILLRRLQLEFSLWLWGGALK